MWKLIFAFLSLGITRGFAQVTYDNGIEDLANQIYSSINNNSASKFGIGSILFSEKQTKLAKEFNDDLSAELASLNSKQFKFVIINNERLNMIDGYKIAESEIQKVLIVGREKKADYVCFGKISEIAKGYKIIIKLYETNEGNLVSAFKTNIIKTIELENMNAQVLDPNPIYGKPGQNIVVTQPLVELPINNLTPLVPPVTALVDPPKPKKEGKFWKFLGGIAENVAQTGIEQVVNHAFEGKKTNTTPTTPQDQTNPLNNSGNLPNQNNGSGNSGNAIPDNNNSSGQLNGNPPVTDNGDCKSYVNIINKTENAVIVRVYKENPVNNFGVREFYSFTIAAGRSKKQKVDRNVEYYYAASNNTNDPVIGSYREYSGTFEVINCNDTLNEDIQ